MELILKVKFYQIFKCYDVIFVFYVLCVYVKIFANCRKQNII